MKIDITAGELIDRLTILEIKLERISAPEARENLQRQYQALQQARADLNGAELDALTAEIKEVNGALWQIEDAIRDHERRGDFGPAFIELARSVYRNNDRRSALKRRIDEHLGSAWREEKSYTTY